MRRLVAVVCAALIVAAPAAAQSPAPAILRFDAGDPPSSYNAALVQRGTECTGQPFFDNSVPFSAPTFLFAPCRPTLRLTFTSPQASVELMARALVVPANELVVRAYAATGATVGEYRVADPSGWKPVVLASPDGSA